MSGKFAIIDELRARRRALGLDLYEVGRRCGLDEAELRDWERGAKLPSPDALERWAGALGFRLALLPIEAGAQRGISVDWKQRHIAVDGTPVRLTPMEWKVLERLAWSPGRLVTHRQLFKYLYGEERDCRAQATAVRVLINKLRRLLPIRIEAQWGQGYVIDGIPPSLSAEDGPAAPDPEGGRITALAADRASAFRDQATNRTRRDHAADRALVLPSGGAGGHRALPGRARRDPLSRSPDHRPIHLPRSGLGQDEAEMGAALPAGRGRSGAAVTRCRQ
jgi:transcriptional regulator with XRE-family HTH domain